MRDGLERELETTEEGTVSEEVTAKRRGWKKYSNTRDDPSGTERKREKNRRRWRKHAH